MQAETRPCLLCMFNRSLFKQKEGVKVHNIKYDTVENYVKHTAVNLAKSIYAWHIFNLTGLFKPGKNQTNMKMSISLTCFHTINSFYNIASKFV